MRIGREGKIEKGVAEGDREGRKWVEGTSLMLMHMVGRSVGWDGRWCEVVEDGRGKDL